jgi:hypothetical protein
MALLSKHDIMTVDDLKVEEVSVPEWGGSVLVRTLTARERDEFESSTVDKKSGKPNLENFRAKLVGLCLVDENGKRLFESRADVTMLGNKSVAALQRVFNKAQELNGFSEEDVEELTEDFDGDPDEQSTSD